jgi:heme/copper-type cytochrome/quinol oxidase subunit 4
MNMADGKKAAMRRGNVVLVLLALLTIVEFYIALHSVSTVLLLIVALLKAAVVAWVFMHMYRLWRGEESHS